MEYIADTFFKKKEDLYPEMNFDVKKLIENLKMYTIEPNYYISGFSLGGCNGVDNFGGWIN